MAGEAQPLVVALDDDQPITIVGGKASSLCELARRGFPVPPACVVTTVAFGRWLAAESEAEREQLQSALRRALQGHLADGMPGDPRDGGGSGPGAARRAVRSSATVEDGTRASFAGLFLSLLHVEEPDIVPAVLEVFGSARRPAVERYARRLGIRALPTMAVLVQEEVNPLVAGVCFTTDPVAGRPDLVIEGIRGFSDGIMAGARSPTISLRLARTPPGPGRLPTRLPTAGRDEEDALTAAMLEELAATAMRIERLFGRPQDIEWAFDHRGLWVLQARPVTTLPTATAT